MYGRGVRVQLLAAWSASNPCALYLGGKPLRPHATKAHPVASGPRLTTAVRVAGPEPAVASTACKDGSEAQHSLTEGWP